MLLTIAIAIALGLIVTLVVAVTYTWFIKHIKGKFANKNTKKVIAANLEALAETCENQVSLDELMNDGYDKVFASIDGNGQVVGDVELVKDLEEDYQVDNALGDEGIMVVNR